MEKQKNQKGAILIVEDDDYLRFALVDSLAAEGYQVDWLTSGAKAAEHIQKKNYSLLLLDLILPVKNGFEVLRELKALKLKIPVLVFTNLSQEKDREEALALGAKAYYVKSNLSIDDVVEKVHQFLR